MSLQITTTLENRVTNFYTFCEIQAFYNAGVDPTIGSLFFQKHTVVLCHRLLKRGTVTIF